MKLKKTSRYILLIAVLAMSFGYFLPLWSIDLEAPQYPEGLSMQLWVNKITGDVEKINGLNHYIGMKLIKQEEFPEFTIMPWILAGMILTGLLTFLANRKWALWAYLLMMMCILAIGIYDFWSWEYDYGHNLDPHAAIKIEGMSYQPPLIGYKQLLNFIALSWPESGGLVIFGSGAVLVGLLFYEQFFHKK